MSASEERLFELDVESLSEKSSWLKKIMKQQVTKKALTQNDITRLIKQVEEKLAAAVHGRKGKGEADIKKRNAVQHLSST